MHDRRIMKQISKKYRNRVRECRLKYLVARQEDLAKKTGISRTTISALENNRLFLSSHYALIIAEALGCSLDELFQNLEESKKYQESTNEKKRGGYFEPSYR